MVVIPEEAEDLLTIVREADESPTHLLAYAAPVTRRMLHFNDLKFYAVPSLAADWEAPLWLRVELGIFSGRLYFEFSEYGPLCDFLGVAEASSKPEEEVNSSTTSALGGTDGATDNIETSEDNGVETAAESKLFTRQPLTFLQEWLAVRRKGQDFAHTPMVSLSNVPRTVAQCDS
jgi:hypothetical protein